MWIRRSFGDDALYTTLVQSYLDTLLQEGYNFECFVGGSTYCALWVDNANICFSTEGGRSRTGKLLQPKFGILSFILESILSNQVEDAIICPVSTQYDKVIEVEYAACLLATLSLLLMFTLQLLRIRTPRPTKAERVARKLPFLIINPVLETWPRRCPLPRTLVVARVCQPAKITTSASNIITIRQKQHKHSQTTPSHYPRLQGSGRYQ